MTRLEMNATECLVAEAAVQRQIAQLRDSGFDVEVVEDLHVIATVRITGAGGESVEMLIDPMHLAKRLRNRATN